VAPKRKRREGVWEVRVYVRTVAERLGHSDASSQEMEQSPIPGRIILDGWEAEQGELTAEELARATAEMGLPLESGVGAGRVSALVLHPGTAWCQGGQPLPPLQVADLTGRVPFGRPQLLPDGPPNRERAPLRITGCVQLVGSCSP
jgi:hypothetical protein